MTSPADRRVAVGIIRRPHGVSGEMSVAPMFDGDPDELLGLELYLDQPVATFPAVLHGESVRFHGERWLLRVREVDSPERARLLNGRTLQVRGGELPASAEQAPYHFELVGCRLVDREGKILGEVRRVEPTPAGDLLVLDDEGNVLVPFRPMIVEVDLENRRLVAEIPEGLLEVNRRKSDD